MGSAVPYSTATTTPGSAANSSPHQGERPKRATIHAHPAQPSPTTSTWSPSSAQGTAAGCPAAASQAASGNRTRSDRYCGRSNVAAMSWRSSGSYA